MIDFYEIAEKNYEIEKVIVEGDVIEVHYIDKETDHKGTLTVIIRNADPHKLDNDTFRLMVLLSELVHDLAESIEFDQDPNVQAYVLPDGYEIIKTESTMGDNILEINHEVHYSNA